ncbi:MAG: hypothetical protein JJE04_06550 [Acidobacteriia bacterium]|nr:hypothetical protein [Terriglobia bacterium]
MLISGENSGKGSRSVMVAANAIQVDGLGVLSNNWLQYGVGINGRIDGFIAYGNIAILGRLQSYASFGSNIGLLRRLRAGLDVALYNNATIAMNHRQQACAVLLISAVVASKPIQAGGHNLTLYGGATRQTPIGRAADAFFTPASPAYAGIVGASVPISGNIALFFEYNPGGTQHSGGVGILYAFPRETNTGDRVGGKDTPAPPAK